MFISKKMMNSIDFMFEDNFNGFSSSLMNKLTANEIKESTGKKRNLIAVNCEFCREEFKTQKSLNRHQTQKHIDKLPHTCTICSEPFLHVKDLSNHMKFHEKETIKCVFCSQTFEKLRDFEKHNVAEHYKNPSGDYECQSCHVTFNAAVQLDHHLRSSNCIQRLKLWACNLCDKTFTTKGSLGTHKKIHQGKKDFRCEQCQKPFRTNSDLQRHINRTHTKMKFYSCPTCDKKFYDKTDLYRHTNRHGKQRTVYECEVCTKKFYVPQAYATHKKKHEKLDDKPYRCEYCRKSFKEIKYLKRHMMKICRNLPNEVTDLLTTVETVIKEESSCSN